MNAKLEIRTFLPGYLIAAIVSLLLGLAVLSLLGQFEKKWILVLSWGLSFVVILVGYLANSWAFKRSHKVFLGVLLGGMAVRIAIIGGIVAIFFLQRWKFLIWFLIFLAVYYFLFQVVEVVVINKQIKKQVGARS